MANNNANEGQIEDFGAEGSERNTAKRGKYQAICDECGKECYTRFSYIKGRAILCKECTLKKIEKIEKIEKHKFLNHKNSLNLPQNRM